MSARLLQALKAKVAGTELLWEAADPPPPEQVEPGKTTKAVKVTQVDVAASVPDYKSAQVRSVPEQALAYMARQSVYTPGRYDRLTALQQVYGTQMPLQTPVAYQRMPNFEDLYRGFTGEADYSRYHPVIEAATKMGSAQALRDFGLLR